MAVDSSTLSEIRDEIRAQVSQPSGSKWLTDSNLNSLVNRSQAEICRFTEVLRGVENPVVTSGNPSYSLPAAWFKTLSVQYSTSGNLNRLLTPFSFDEYMGISTVNTSDIPTHYAIDLSTSKLYIYPTPSSSVDTYRHIYIKQPDKLESDSDIPFNGDARLYAYHSELVDLAVSYISARKEGVPSAQVLTAFMPRLKTMKQSLSSTRKPQVLQSRRDNYRSSMGVVRFPSNY